jgi:hypothetical protein
MGSSPSTPKAQSSGSRKSETGWRRVRFDEMAENIGDRVENPAEAGVVISKRIRTEFQPKSKSLSQATLP